MSKSDDMRRMLAIAQRMSPRQRQYVLDVMNAINLSNQEHLAENARLKKEIQRLRGGR